MYDGLYAIAFGVRISSASISNNIYKNMSNDWRRRFTLLSSEPGEDWKWCYVDQRLMK
jgi:hypothetical protein